MTRYVIREYGQEEIFQLRPVIGEAVHLAKSPIAPSTNEVFLLFTRASNKHPMLHEVLHLCLFNLIRQLDQNCIAEVRFPIYDPECSNNILPTWYAILKDHFTESNTEIVLQGRAYVSIASATATNGR